jgi:hypothetical protein
LLANVVAATKHNLLKGSRREKLYSSKIKINVKINIRPRSKFRST